MVKGVNKTVIEINETGNDFFEKVVFYVSPKFSGANKNHLKSLADEFLSSNINRKGAKTKSLRKRVRLKKEFKIAFLLFFALSFLSSVVFALIKIF